MEMFDLRADYKTLPDETLRRHFRRFIKRQRRFAAFTFCVAYSCGYNIRNDRMGELFCGGKCDVRIFDASSNAF